MADLINENLQIDFSSVYNEQVILNESIFNFFKKKDTDEEINQKTAPERFENFKGKFFSRITIDDKTKTFIIKGINFDKFEERLKEMYKYKGIQTLFEKRYSAWQEYLWNKEKISKDEMKVTRLTVPMFFALEIYKIFQDLAEFYGLSYYNKAAKMIHDKTWISNFSNPERLKVKGINKSLLNNIQYTLKDYQLDFIQKYPILKSMYDLDGYLLSFEQGLGKTLTSIALAEGLAKDQVIIVCPNSLKEVWALEIRNYYLKYSNSETLWKNDIWVNGIAKYNISKKPRFIITNQEAIAKIFNIVKPYMNTIIIVDECHNFRNMDSDRSKELIKLKELTDCKDNLLMSGTPIKAVPSEIIPALRMIDPYFTEEMALIYRKAFNKYSEEITRVTRERFSRIIYKKTKEQVLKLPNKTIIKVKLSVKDEKPYLLETVRAAIVKDFNIEYKALSDQYAKYRDRFEELVKQYSGVSKKETEDYLRFINHMTDSSKNDIIIHEKREAIYKQFIVNNVLPNVTSSAIKKEILELTAKYIYMDRSAMGKAIGKNLPPAKTNCYINIFNNNREWLEEKIKKNPKKTVIFTPFLGVAKYIAGELDKDGISTVLIIGETKNRADVIEKFKEDDQIDVLVATVQTLSTGVTLTEADQMFFFGTPYREADFAQACDRIHRIGQTNDVNIYILILKSSKKNITDRIQEIMDWSGTASGEFMDI